MMNVRIADLKDFEKIMKIYKYAQDYMIQSGNPTQWGHFYPDEELIRSDIHQNACKVIYDENGIHGVQLVNQNNHLHVKIFFRRIAILRNCINGFKVSIHQSLARISCVFSDHVLQPRGHTPGKPRRGSPSIPRVTSCPGRAVLRCISKNFPGTGSAGLFEIHKINQLGAEKRA